MEHFGLINELMIILAASVVVAALCYRLGIPTIVSYLLVGIAVGPGLGLVTSISEFQVIAEFGVAFLLFTLGLEFSLPKLIALRRVVFGMGSLQVVIAIALFGVLIYLTRQIYLISLQGTVVAACALALSSTAIVTKELTNRNEIATSHGNLAVGILLFQDIAAIVMLVLISVGEGADGAGIWTAIGLAGIKAIIFFFVMVAIGKRLLPPVFTEIGKTHSEELFVLTVLVVALVAAAAAHSLGLSMALGAFIAGMMLGESHFRHRIEEEIRPFRDVLLGIFFVSVGLILDIDLIFSYWPRIIVLTLCLLVFKTLLIALLCRAFGSDTHVALRTGLILCQGGEFGFALMALAVAGHLIPQDVASFFISIIVLSMAATPFIVSNSSLISARLLARVAGNQSGDADTQQAALEKARNDHVVLCGYGRVGQTIARFLRMEAIPFVALDDDPLRVQRANAAGEPVVFGNARKTKLLDRLGLAEAALVIVSFDDPRVAVEVIRHARSVRSDLPVLVRTRDDAELAALQEAGATEVIPETLEASLMLVSHVMATLGLPANRVFETMRQVRRERYRLLHGFIGRGGECDEGGGCFQSVCLPRGARAVGKTIAELDLDGRAQVRIYSVRKGLAVQENPPPDTRLEADDIVVLSGEPRDVESAESYLLRGR